MHRAKLYIKTQKERKFKNYKTTLHFRLYAFVKLILSCADIFFFISHYILSGLFVSVCYFMGGKMNVWQF